MDQTNPPLPPPDLSHFQENVNDFPSDELAKYAGMFVAFSLDGRRIVASGKDREELWDNLEAAGIHFSQVVGSYVDPPDETIL